ncbi:PREDICTED: transmembrane protein 192 isoform X2 [Crocodylus porosus]|uniref:transmembrane protein 192 isoform X2 n=1 Tax=Crocodylus porosus TaxID=8502 RepID=UPI00093D9322|nr:PREDICTED: transmembrane protein 192 isoform X2 [Crocodylus porosus]
MEAAAGAGRQRQELDNGSLEITQSTEDDHLLDTPLLPSHALHSRLRPRFYAIPTVFIANFLLLVHYHHSKARSRGYLSIYRSTRHLKRLPLVVHSTGNTALLLILSAQHSFPDNNRLYLYIILGILTLELICSLTCLVVYTVKISNFNQAKSRPDIIEEEKMYAYPCHIISETGFRENSSLEEIVEKQGDVIEYLQRHNALLSRRLLALTSQQIRDFDHVPFYFLNKTWNEGDNKVSCQ